MGQKWLLLILCAVCWTAVTRGQAVEDGRRGIAGVVYDRDSLMPLGGAACRWGKQVQVADEGGRFFVEAKVGDTLRFTHVGYEPAEVVVADSLAGKDYLLGIFLGRDTVMLAEVLILPRIRRMEMRLDPMLQNAQYNLNQARWAASRPVERMDREMNQRMSVEEFARRVEMKGMVDVQFGVGLYTLRAWQALKAAREAETRWQLASPREVDLLKRIFASKRKEKRNN